MLAQQRRPSRLMRAPVDSSESTMRPLRFSRERVELLLAGRLLDAARELARRSTASASSRFSGRVPTYSPTSPVCGEQVGEAEDRVGQAAALAHLLEQPRGGRAAEDAFEHAQREAALVVAREPGAAEAHVVLLGLLRRKRTRRSKSVRGELARAQAARCRRRLGLPARAPARRARRGRPSRRRRSRCPAGGSAPRGRRAAARA